MAEHFGRYELLRRIGAGGMAEVFKAKTFGPEGFVKEVVIKRILPAFNEDPDFVEMFVNEARLAAKLQHANIVQIFDFNQIDGVYYIAMEWVEGTDLHRVVTRSSRRDMPVPVKAAVHAGVETLKGLHYASTRTDDGVPLCLVHRDISPHNLLVSFAGEVKITDFGIAKVAALASATRSGMLKGKLGYMSPEQASGAALDARSDIFSLGIVLWEMLTGRHLYRGESEAELFAQVKRAEVPPPRASRPDVSEDLEAVVLRMLAKEPEDRYATAAEALEDLSRFAGGSDSLTMAAFVRQLMPDAATAEEPGQTLPMDVPAAREVSVSPPDAETRTRNPAGDAVAAEPADTVVQPSSISAMETVRRPDGRRLRWVLLASAVLCVVVGWFVVRTGGPKDRPPPTEAGRLVRKLPEPSSGAEPDAAVAPDQAVQLAARGPRSLQDPALDAATAGRPAPRRIRGGWGVLDVVVFPWARVRVNGQDLGATPLRRHRLRTGRHQVELRNQELGKRVTVSVEIRAGKTTVLRKNWD